MPVTDAPIDAAPQRHGIYMPARGTFVAAGRERDVSRMPDPDIRFGIGLWPSEAAPHLDADDAFRNAAVRLRPLGPKLVAALQALQVPLEDLKNRTVGAIEEELTRELVERTPLHVDLAAQYLAELLDHVAALVPSCYGPAGQPLVEARGSLRRLAQSPLDTVDPTLAALIAPDGALPAWAETLAAPAIGQDSDFSALPLANDPNIYLILNHPNFDRAAPEQKLTALKASANQTIAAAEAIDDSLLGMFHWLDQLLEHLIHTVCNRVPDGDHLRQRWTNPHWTIIQPLSFFDTDAALAITRAFPAISEGPLLPGTESE